MGLGQELLFQGILSEPTRGLAVAFVLLVGVVNFLTLILIVRKLPFSKQVPLVFLGLFLSAAMKIVCITLGFAKHRFPLMDFTLGAFLIFLAVSTLPRFSQSAMPSHSKSDYWVAVVWMLIVNLAMTRVSVSAISSSSSNLSDELFSFAVGYVLVCAFALWLFNYAGRIRGLVRTSSWLTGLCGGRLLLGELGASLKFNFDSLQSKAMWIFWGLFLVIFISSLLRRGCRSIDVPFTQSGRASFLVKK